MEVLPPQTERGHEEPYAYHFSIFMANRIGQLRDLLETLTRERVALLGFSVFDSSDWAVVRAVFSEPMKAREVLKRHGLAFTETEAILVELTEEKDLGVICGYLLGAEINVHFAYSLITRVDDKPVMALHVDEHDLAAQVLSRHGFKVIGEEDLPT
jgi:hypothetical protein